MSVCPHVARHLADVARVDQQQAEADDPSTTDERRAAIVLQWRREISRLDS